MRYRRACSWCDQLNEISQAHSVWCSRCGHRADLARLRCNCPACRGEESLERESQLSADHLIRLPLPYDFGVASS
jgi:DNA-directed RNA polymerase subunit RPC12/RpoP